MGDVLQFVPRSLAADGSKSRIQRRRAKLFPVSSDELLMDHADVTMPCDSAYHAPDSDPA